MSAPAQEPVRWRTHRWFLAAGALFLLQVGVIVRFGAPPEPIGTRDTVSISFRLAADPASGQQLRHSVGFTDPALFALASQRGFSGRAWLTPPRFQHQLATWTEPWRWLEPDRASLGQDLTDYIATNQSPPASLVHHPLGPRPGLQFYILPQLVLTQSELRIEGPLAQRPLLNSPSLPSWPAEDILGHTALQLLVDASGQPLSVTPLQGSGAPEADQYAMAAAGQMRFAPLTADRPLSAFMTNSLVTWGKLLFQWHTAPLSATNHTPPPPRP